MQGYVTTVNVTKDRKSRIFIFVFTTTENVFNPFCVQIIGIMLDWAHYFVFT